MPNKKTMSRFDLWNADCFSETDLIDGVYGSMAKRVHVYPKRKETIKKGIDGGENK